jgi:Mor family transcriptional regulator
MAKKVNQTQAALIGANESEVFQAQHNDLIDDVLLRVMEAAPGLSATLAREIGQKVRHDWAGDTVKVCYIARESRAVRSQRNEAIKRDWQRGERLPLLERRYGLSERRIRQILFEEN